MKIKLAILERDPNCLNRIVNAINTKYANKFEIYSFTNAEIAVSVLSTSSMDVILASDYFDINPENLPPKCAFAYLVDSLELENLNNCKAICKFQKTELFYQQIINLYYEKSDRVAAVKIGDKDSKLIAFCSVGGGTGASSVAASAAIYNAAKDKKTLYLNLEKFGSADSFFSGEGKGDMSDIIFAVKSKSSQLRSKLTEHAKQDETGVYFYSQPKVALNMYEFSAEDILFMLSELQESSAYDYIIVDMNFELDAETLKIFNQMDSVIFVGDGSEISNNKIFRAYTSLVLIEENTELALTDRLGIIYNKFSNKTSKMLTDINIRNIGGFPRYKNATCTQIIGQLGQSDIFSKII